MTSAPFTNLVKRCLYVACLCCACVVGYLYGTVSVDNNYQVNPFRSKVVYNWQRDTIPDVSRSFQSSLPFGVCDEGDCSAIPAEDIAIVKHGATEVKSDKDNQDHRRETIKQMCSKYEDLNTDQISDVTLKQLIVDEQHKLIYCAIPKAGCTNWKRILMVAKNESIDLQTISKDFAHHNHLLRTLYEYPSSDRTRILETFKKFTFVRDPFIRLLSAYKDKFEYLWQYRDDPNGVYFRRYAATIMTTYRPNATAAELESGENVTWTEFVLYVTHLRDGQFNAHWLPMYKLCAPCQIDYDFVGRIENVDDDWTLLLEKLFGVNHGPERFPHDFDTTTNSSAFTYGAYGDITVQQLRNLWNTYKWDFWLFGYDKPDFI